MREAVGRMMARLERPWYRSCSAEHLRKIHRVFGHLPNHPGPPSLLQGEKNQRLGGNARHLERLWRSLKLACYLDRASYRIYQGRVRAVSIPTIEMKQQKPTP